MAFDWTASLCAHLGVLVHPGHGRADPDGLLHYLTEPEHALVVVVGGLMLLGGLALFRLRLRDGLGIGAMDRAAEPIQRPRAGRATSRRT